MFQLLDWVENNDKINNLVIVSSIPWTGQDWTEFEQREQIGQKVKEVMNKK